MNRQLKQKLVIEQEMFMIRKEYNVPVEQLPPDQPTEHVQTPGLLHTPLTQPDEHIAKTKVSY